MNSKLNWQDTSTLASLMLGELVQKEWPLGQSILRDEFTGGLEREYEGLSALLERHCPEDLREASLNRVDGLLRLCMRRGLGPAAAPAAFPWRTFTPQKQRNETDGGRSRPRSRPCCDRGRDHSVL